MTNRNAIELLRKLLDERGVGYDARSKATFFNGRFGENVTVYPSESNTHKLVVKHYTLTPEQAVAVSLGGGKLTAEQVRKAIERHAIPSLGCRWQFIDRSYEAIADELNAELGSGTCEPKWTLQGETQTQEFWRCECGNCGHEFGVEDRRSFPFKMTISKVDIPNYCPNCGKAVRS